jgi:hypothetical protein
MFSLLCVGQWIFYLKTVFPAPAKEILGLYYHQFDTYVCYDTKEVHTSYHTTLCTVYYLKASTGVVCKFEVRLHVFPNTLGHPKELETSQFFGLIPTSD